MYDQIDGVAMGFLLTPIIANILMGYHKNGWIMDGFIIITGMLMIYLQFLNLKITLLFHFTITLIDNKVI